MRLVSLLALAIVVLLLGATCSRSDELICPPGQRKYHCRMECMARPCGEPYLTYLPRVAETMLCAADVLDAVFKFGEAVRNYDVKDCSPPDCRAIGEDTGSALMPNGGAGDAYHEQGETETGGAAGGWTWEPLPGGAGCVP